MARAIMVGELLFVIILAVVVLSASALAEGVLSGMPVGYARELADSGTRGGAILLALKERPARTYSSLLIVGALALAVGFAVGGGWMAAEWGVQGALLGGALVALVMVVTCVFIPRTVGALHFRHLALAMAIPLGWLVRILSPVVALMEWISGSRGGSPRDASVSADELLSLAEIGLREGTLDEFEGEVIVNIIGLDELRVHDVQTPRLSLFRVEESQTLASVREALMEWSFSRIPLYDERDPEHLTGYVVQRDLTRALLRGEDHRALHEFRRPLKVVPEVMKVEELLKTLFAERIQIAATIDEHGGLAGVVTLEDLLEELVGHEIVDEYDFYGLRLGEDARQADKVIQFTRNREKKLRAFEKRKEQVLGAMVPPTASERNRDQPLSPPTDPAKES